MRYLCIGEKYEKNGEEKMSWKRIGEMFESKAGKTYVKLYHIPNTLISVFEDKPKVQNESGKDSFGADMELPAF